MARVITMSAALSEVTTSQTSVANDGVASTIISVFAKDTRGEPIRGLAAARFSPSSTGTNNTFVALDSVSDSNGRFRWTFTSTTAQAKTVSVAVLGTTVTDTASVTFTGSPPTPWFEETWNYTDTANMQSDPNNWFDADRQDQPALSSITLDTGLTTPWGGTKALKLSFDDMSVLPSGTEVELGKNIAFPSAAADQPKTVWIEFYIKFEDQWTTNFGDGTFDHKTFFALQKDTAGSRYRWDLRIGNSIGSDPGSVLQAPGQSSNYWLNTAANGSSTGRIGANTYFWDGNWHLVRLQLAASSDFEVTDAVKRMTVDGVLVANQTGFFTPGDADGGARPTENEYFAYLALGRNINRPNQAQAFWFGRLRVYITDPSWVF